MGLIDLTGQKLGNTVVLGRAKNKKKAEHAYWRCRCGCGTIFSRVSKSLRKGHVECMHCLTKKKAKICQRCKINKSVPGTEFRKYTHLCRRCYMEL